MQNILTHQQQQRMTLDQLIEYEKKQLHEQYESGDFLNTQYRVTVSNKRWNQHADAKKQICKRLLNEYIAYNFIREHSLEIQLKQITHEQDKRVTLKQQCELNIMLAAYQLPKNIAAIAIAQDLLMIEMEEARTQHTHKQWQRRTDIGETNITKPKKQRRAKPKKNKRK